MKNDPPARPVRILFSMRNAVRRFSLRNCFMAPNARIEAGDLDWGRRISFSRSAWVISCLRDEPCSAGGHFSLSKQLIGNFYGCFHFPIIQYLRGDPGFGEGLARGREREGRAISYPDSD